MCMTSTHVSALLCCSDAPQGMELMPQNLNGSRRKHVPLGKLAARAARLPGAPQLQAAGQLPRRLLIPHEDDRALVAGAEAFQSAMPRWHLEAACRQRQARGGGALFYPCTIV